MGEFFTVGGVGPKLLPPRGFGNVSFQGSLWPRPTPFGGCSADGRANPDGASGARIDTAAWRSSGGIAQEFGEGAAADAGHANQHRRDVQFEVGDRVLLKLQQYRQHSVARPLSAKLAKRFYGPFVITEKIGSVAYRLALPPGARIHNVFHVSLLRPFVEGGSAASEAVLPEEFLGARPVGKPIRVLDHRVALHDGIAVEQVLVEWSGDPSVAPSWEPLGSIRSCFPHLLEDKEFLIRGGVDTSTVSNTSRETAQGQEEVNRESDEEDASAEESEEPSSREPSSELPKRVSRCPAKFDDYV